jgi:PAS domain-containing protein
LTSVPFWEFVHPEDQHAMVESTQRLIDGSAPRLGYEVRMLRRDGHYVRTRWDTASTQKTGYCSPWATKWAATGRSSPTT